MMAETVLPWVAAESAGAGEVLAATFKIHGLTESKLGDLLKPIPLSDRVRLSYRAHFPDLTLRLTVRRERVLFPELKAKIRELIGPYIYNEGEEGLEEIVGRLLLAKQWTLALAESCTGGAIAQRITRVAGSSAYFKASAVTYSDDSKSRFLGIESALLKKHGAVSRETALEMARKVRELAAADIGLSVTGIAGPSGGSPDNPIGTVWVGLADREATDARRFQFQGDRERVILGASQTALHWLKTTLDEK
jgi:nicotinamide-nucleotide amidase